MTCSMGALCAAALPTPLHGLRGTVRRWWKSYWLGRGRRATVFMLRSLDEHTLRDIGVDRSEIESVVHGEAAERRHCYVPDWK